MTDLVILTILAFASFRLTRFFVIDTIFEGFRAKFHVFLTEKAEKSEKLSLFWHKLLELTSCSWCFGFWVSLTLYSLYLWQYPWDLSRLDWISVFAVTGLQGLLHSWEPE